MTVAMLLHTVVKGHLLKQKHQTDDPRKAT